MYTSVGSAEQARLRESVKEEDTEDWQRSPDFSGLERVGGVDLSFIKDNDINACAHLVVLTYPHMKLLYEDCKMVTLNVPYVAGFLGFREAPPLLQALEKLKNEQPNLMPQFGLACHLGVLSDLPCVGVAKNLLHVEGVLRSEEHHSQNQILAVLYSKAMDIRKWFKDSSLTKTNLTNNNVCGIDSGANQMVVMENLSNETQVHSVDRAAGVIMNGPTSDVIAVAAIDDLGNEGPNQIILQRDPARLLVTGLNIVSKLMQHSASHVECSVVRTP
ncbi:unnamed protein product [Leuciscus chuanchicus]